MYSDAADAFQCFAMSAQPYTIEEEYATVEIPTVRLG
jgi:hypothetical protein